MARQDVAEGFLVRIVALGRCDQSLLVQVAGPAMRAQRQHDLAQFLVISRNQAAFHRRDMVREETTEAAHDTECPGLFSSERSDEHTSELQSLMRNSYAVFCSKKKNSTPYTDYEQLSS